MKINKVITLGVFILISALGFAQHGSSASMPSMGPTTTSQDPSNLGNGYSGSLNRNVIITDSIRKNWYKVDGSVVTESVLSFLPFFEDSVIDSFWLEFRMISKNSDDTHTAGHIIDLKKTEKSYLILFKAMYGDSFGFAEQRKSLSTDTVSHNRTAEIVYKASSNKSKGLIDVVFNIGYSHNVILQRVNFFPFDYSPNTFIDNLCGNELSLIKTQQIDALIDTVALYADADKMKNIKEVSNRLATIKLSSNILFSSLLIMDKNDLWVVGIYDTDDADERLMLGYKLIGKKFKPALVELIKKGG